MAKKLTNKEMSNGIVNNFNNLNLLANYINDFIEFKRDTISFKLFIKEKYETMREENGQNTTNNSGSDRKDKSGDKSNTNKTGSHGKSSKNPTKKGSSPKA